MSKTLKLQVIGSCDDNYILSSDKNPEKLYTIKKDECSLLKGDIIEVSKKLENLNSFEAKQISLVLKKKRFKWLDSYSFKAEEINENYQYVNSNHSYIDFGITSSDLILVGPQRIEFKTWINDSNKSKILLFRSEPTEDIKIQYNKAIVSEDKNYSMLINSNTLVYHNRVNFSKGTVVNLEIDPKITFELSQYFAKDIDASNIVSLKERFIYKYFKYFSYFFFLFSFLAVTLYVLNIFFDSLYINENLETTVNTFFGIIVSIILLIMTAINLKSFKEKGLRNETVTTLSIIKVIISLVIFISLVISFTNFDLNKSKYYIVDDKVTQIDSIRYDLFDIIKEPSIVKNGLPAVDYKKSSVLYFYKDSYEKFSTNEAEYEYKINISIELNPIEELKADFWIQAFNKSLDSIKEFEIEVYNLENQILLEKCENDIKYLFLNNFLNEISISIDDIRNIQVDIEKKE